MGKGQEVYLVIWSVWYIWAKKTGDGKIGLVFLVDSIYGVYSLYLVESVYKAENVVNIPLHETLFLKAGYQTQPVLLFL